jgi:hypothetical protein
VVGEGQRDTGRADQESRLVLGGLVSEVLEPEPQAGIEPVYHGRGSLIRCGGLQDSGVAVAEGRSFDIPLTAGAGDKRGGRGGGGVGERLVGDGLAGPREGPADAGASVAPRVAASGHRCGHTGVEFRPGDVRRPGVPGLPAQQPVGGFADRNSLAWHGVSGKVRHRQEGERPGDAVCQAGGRRPGHVDLLHAAGVLVGR